MGVNGWRPDAGLVGGLVQKSVLGGKAFGTAVVSASEQKAEEGDGAAEEQEGAEGVGAVAAEVVKQAGGVKGGDAVQEAPGEVDQEGKGGPEEGFAGGKKSNGDGEESPADEEAEEGGIGVAAVGVGLVPEGREEGFPVEQEAEHAAAEEGEPACPGGPFVVAAQRRPHLRAALLHCEGLLGGGAKGEFLGMVGDEAGVDLLDAGDVAVPGVVL